MAQTTKPRKHTPAIFSAFFVIFFSAALHRFGNMLIHRLFRSFQLSKHGSTSSFRLNKAAAAVHALVVAGAVGDEGAETCDSELHPVSRIEQRLTAVGALGHCGYWGSVLVLG